MQFLARRDVLTELPNRAMCVETLQTALQQAQTNQECLAVLFIDLDGSRSSMTRWATMSVTGCYARWHNVCNWRCVRATW